MIPPARAIFLKSVSVILAGRRQYAAHPGHHRGLALSQIAYSKVKHCQLDSQKVLDCLESGVERIWQGGLQRHLLGLVADECAPQGFHIITDLRHLQQRMTAIGHVDLLLGAVHKRRSE